MIKVALWEKLMKICIRSLFLKVSTFLKRKVRNGMMNSLLKKPINHLLTILNIKMENDY
jgi:ABC-type uncharacterized transport system permease subunit